MDDSRCWITAHAGKSARLPGTSNFIAVYNCFVCIRLTCLHSKKTKSSSLLSLPTALAGFPRYS